MEIKDYVKQFLRPSEQAAKPSAVTCKRVTLCLVNSRLKMHADAQDSQWHKHTKAALI